MAAPRKHRRASGRRQRRLLAVLALAAVGILVAVVTNRGDSKSSTDRRATTTAAAAATRLRASRPRRVHPIRLVEHATGALTAAVQDAAATALPNGSVMLLGGLTAADISRGDILTVTSSGGRPAGMLPTAVHDTAVVVLGGAVYLFGGGTNAGTQSDEIVRVPAAGGTPATVGRLPAPSSDQSAAAIDGTAYIVGGYTGSRWLDTIVAWRPGHPARVAARLPYTLRYAAVTAVGRKLVIAGGSLENGTASATVLAYTPGGRVVRLATLPAPTTHAAAAAIGDIAYVIGGRGAATTSLTSRIVAIDIRSGRVHPAGSLTEARSDLAAVTLGHRILLAGGRTPAGTVATLSELIQQRRTVSQAPRATRAATATQNVYAYDGANMLTGPARAAKPLVYVPNSESDTVTVIDPATDKVVDTFPVGGLPQHVVPAWNLKTLYVTNDTGNSLTAIDPRTGKPEGAPIPVDDPYNMYFTPDGRYAIVVAERLHRLDFRDAHSFRLHHSLSVPCSGVDHMDFTADGRYLLASCEFSGQMVVVDVADERVLRTIDLPGGGAMPQDVRLSPDGRTFYVADMHRGGVWEIGARSFRVLGFLPTGAGAHGLYPSRNGKLLYVSNRSEGSISVISFRTHKQVTKWRIPDGSPDMGGVSADGKTLWLSGRYASEVYAISTRTGKLLARIHVGTGPHGLCVWPQPGRYSLGHTDNMR